MTHLAEASAVTRPLTLAFEIIDEVSAPSPVEAGPRSAVVDVLFTVLTAIPGRAIALVSLGIHKENQGLSFFQRIFKSNKSLD